MLRGKVNRKALVNPDALRLQPGLDAEGQFRGMILDLARETWENGFRL